MENKLFSDAEVFQKERPTKCTDSQLKEFYTKMANELKSEGHSDSPINLIAHDLENLFPFIGNGYEMAKKLEGYSAKASYDLGTSLCEFLDRLEIEYNEILEDNVKTWVKAHNPKPMFKKGDKLLVVESIDWVAKSGEFIYVNGDKESVANYLVHQDKERNGGYVIAYEKIESKCKPA